MSRRYYKKKESTTKMVDEYYDYLIKYQKMYGEKVLVLYQNGKFYEIYGVENDEEKWGDVINIAENILHMQWTYKASKEDKFSDSYNCYYLDDVKQQTYQFDLACEHNVLQQQSFVVV